MEDRRLASLARMAIPICKEAREQCPRSGPGRPADYSDWQMAVLILIAVLKRRKSKPAQYQYLKQHANEVKRWLGLRSWPARSTYFERYLRAWRLFEAAIEIMGRCLFKRRRKAVEPFIEWLKNLFDLHGCVWHRGLRNNNTQMLAAIYAYQILVQYNRRFATKAGEIQWILDGL